MSKTGSEQAGREKHHGGIAYAPLLVAGLVIVLWGATPVVTKLATNGIDGLTVGVARTLLGGLVAAPLAILMRLKLPRGRAQWSYFLAAAVPGYVVFPVLFSIAQRETSAQHSSLLLALLPLFTGLIATGLERRLPRGRWFIGAAIAIVGECLLVFSRDGMATGGATLFGDALVLIAGITATIGYVSGARLSQLGYSVWGTTFWGVALAAFILLPAAPFVGFDVAFETGGLISWSAVLFLAYMTTIVGYAGWYWALGSGGIARVALLQFFQPISGLILAVFLLSEPLTLSLLLAAAMVLLGVWIAAKR
ncbi:MAG: DMT family transporter [Dongiaceae bacterium]